MRVTDYSELLEVVGLLLGYPLTPARKIYLGNALTSGRIYGAS